LLFFLLACDLLISYRVVLVKKMLDKKVSPSATINAAS